MNSGHAVAIRRARPGDLEAVAAIFLSCWHDSYAEFLPADVIGLYDIESARALWQPSISDPSRGRLALVAEQSAGEVVGVTAIGIDPDEPSVGHVYSLYVRSDTQGLGVGSRLLAAASDRFRDRGTNEATLWVFAANSAAMAFYSHLGWRPDGAKRVEPKYRQPELRLRRVFSRGSGSAG